MNPAPIGYYVHHQGAGHRHRADLIAAALDRPVTLIGTLGDIDTRGSVLDLPDDRLAPPDDRFDGRDGEAGRPDAFHYVPLGASAIQTRMTRIAAWVASADPALIVVDVSVEVALFARLLSVPTLVVRLAGTRTDIPHLEAFRSAERLLAPFPEALESEGTPDWVRAKTDYAGFLGLEPLAAGSEDGSILVIFGGGGVGGNLADLASAARAVPERTWHVLGPVTGERIVRPANLHLHGWLADVTPHLAKASLVVGTGGDGVVAAVAAHAKRFVCIPEPRPFEEQIAKARRLQALGAAILCEAWPSAGEWPQVVGAGLALDGAVIAGLVERGAVRRTSDAIARLADTCEARRR